MHSSAYDAVQPWLGLIESTAERHDLDHQILAGLVYVESSGNPWAIRVERGFWRRYNAGILRWVAGTPTRWDNRWSSYPDLYAASYGLCQIMLQTAAENGFSYQYPTELLDPERNLELGARILARNITRTGSYTEGLLRYNGGGDEHYPSRVRRARRLIYGSET